MAIGCHRAAAGGEIVMSRWAVVGERPIGIDVQTLGELALDRDSEHIGRLSALAPAVESVPGTPPGGVMNESLCCPGSPGARNACAEPMCRLRVLVSG